MSEHFEHSKVKIGSDRSFGIVFAVVFAVIAFWPLVDSAQIRLWALVLGATLAAIAWLAPHVLKPLNRLWFKIGLGLGRVVSPVVMLLLFATTITPIALIMRVMGKDLLKQKLDPSTSSYWISRETPATPMKNQF